MDVQCIFQRRRRFTGGCATPRRAKAAKPCSQLDCYRPANQAWPKRSDAKPRKTRLKRGEQEHSTLMPRQTRGEPLKIRLKVDHLEKQKTQLSSSNARKRKKRYPNSQTLPDANHFTLADFCYRAPNAVGEGGNQDAPGFVQTDLSFTWEKRDAILLTVRPQ